MASDRISVVLVDDEVTVRQGLRMRIGLEPDIVIVGEAADELEAVRLVQALSPQVVVMDVEMPGRDGIAAMERLHEIAPSVSVIVLSIHDDVRTEAQAREAGARDFISKHGPVDHLLDAIRRTAQSEGRSPHEKATTG